MGFEADLGFCGRHNRHRGPVHCKERRGKCFSVFLEPSALFYICLCSVLADLAGSTDALGSEKPTAQGKYVRQAEGAHPPSSLKKG